MLLDELMPEYEFSERHRVSIEAPAGRALEAAKQATPGEMPLVRLLFRVRSLPAIPSRGGGLPTGSSEPLLAQMMDSGFVFLGEEPDREVILGVIGQMFKLRGDAPAIRNAREFVAFEEPGYAKAAMNFYVEP